MEDGPEVELLPPDVTRASGAVETADSATCNSGSSGTAWGQSTSLSWAERLRGSLNDKAPPAEEKVRLNVQMVVGGRREQAQKADTHPPVSDSRKNHRSGGTSRKSRSGANDSIIPQTGANAWDKHPRSRTDDWRKHSRGGVSKSFKNGQNCDIGGADDWRNNPQKGANGSVKNVQNGDTASGRNLRGSTDGWRKNPGNGVSDSNGGGIDSEKEARSSPSECRKDPRDSASDFGKNLRNGTKLRSQRTTRRKSASES